MQGKEFSHLQEDISSATGEKNSPREAGPSDPGSGKFAVSKNSGCRGKEM